MRPIQNGIHQFTLGNNRLSPAIGGGQFLKAVLENTPFIIY
jgi:hypothetical protein